MAEAPRRLWDKGAPLDELVHRFSVGDDSVWDLRLVQADCIGSAAHARTLHRAGLLSDAELASLLSGLRTIAEEHRHGRFTIPPALEDCHTAIEARLVAHCGPAGERIHTGRSRNDQVATAMRLVMRSDALHWLDRLGDLLHTLLARIQRDGAQPMPGYTHLRPAMPSSVGQWLHAHAEGLLEQGRATLDLLDRLDACPLGTGAGFGVPLRLDRAFTAELLGFSRVQRSPIDVQNSRGRLERYFARVAADIGAVIERLAWDLLLFSTAEFGFFSLPESLTTGSSIMPQKRNPDVLELMRAHGARLRVRTLELDWVAGKLPSSYHRDLQLTKEPALRAADEVCTLLVVAARVVELFIVHGDRLTAAMRPELYATEEALRLVETGVPFRQAYRQVAADLSAGRAPRASAQAGQVGADELTAVAADWSAIIQQADRFRRAEQTAARALAP